MVVESALRVSAGSNRYAIEMASFCRESHELLPNSRSGYQPGVLDP